MWRFPEFRQFMQHWNGYEKFIKGINFRSRKLLEAEKYMPEGFSLREYIRQEKIRLLSRTERAKWIERYKPQPVEPPTTESPPAIAPPDTRVLANAEIAAPRANQLRMLDQQESRFLQEATNSYEQALTHNAALSSKQRSRLENRTQLLAAADISRQAIQHALNREHELITNSIAAWRKRIVLDNQGALLGATDQLFSLAQRYNQEGLVVESLNATDACWSILDTAEKVGATLFTKDTEELFNHIAEQYVKIPRQLRAFFGDPIAGAMLLTGNARHESADELEFGIIRGIARGVTEFRDDKIDALLHPIETIKETVIALSHLCARLDHYILQDCLLKTARDNLIFQEQFFQAAGNDPGERSRSSTQALTDALHEREQWGTLWDRCRDVYAYLTEEQSQQVPPEQRAEEITAMITKQLLNVGTTYAIGAGISQAGSALGQAVAASSEAALLTPALAVATDGMVAVEGVAAAETVADALGRAGVVIGKAIKVGAPTISLLARKAKSPENRPKQHNAPGARSQTPIDIKKFPKDKKGKNNFVNYRYGSKTEKAYYNSADKTYWAVDKAKHGGKAYKVFERRGKKLYWIKDADEYGNTITNAYKSPVCLDPEITGGG